MTRLSPLFSALWKVQPGHLCESSVVFHGVDDKATSERTMRTVLREFGSRPSSTEKVSVHFDDAYASIAPWVAALAECGTSVTVFVPTDWVGKDFCGRTVLSWEAIRELASLPGVNIQSHAASHVNLTRMDMSDVARELTDSKRKIEDHTGLLVSEIAYPRGRWSPEIARVASELGYRIGWTVRSGHFGCSSAEEMARSRLVAQARESAPSLLGQCARSTCRLHLLRGRRT